MSADVDRMIDESLLESEPYPQFDRWLADAQAAGLRDFNAMTLATVTTAGRPSARIVLLRGHGTDGFTFFTHYTGRKGAELAADPWAALVFFWPTLERQIRVEGTVLEGVSRRVGRLAFARLGRKGIVSTP